MDTHQPEDLVAVTGYPGRSGRAGYYRLFGTPGGTDYVEVPTEQVVRSEGLADADSPDHAESRDDARAPATLWVLPGTRLRHTRTTTTQGAFLSGGITSAFLSGARGARVGGGGVGINYPRTEDKLCEIVTYCSSCASVFGQCPTGVGCRAF